MQFNQPDSVIPDPYNSLDWNRYSYARNNPVRFSDPSGHRPCEDGNCQINPLAYRITYGFGWILKGDDWTGKELQGIFVTGNNIKHSVDEITNGKGQEWMDKYMSGVNISIGSGDRGSSIPGNISLPNWWEGGDKFDKYYLAHELAHTWDLKTGHLGMIGAVNGPGDFLNEYITEDNGILGSWSCRFCDGSGYDHIPDNYLFTSGVMVDADGRPYGNNSTADYLAESFALNLYYPEAGHVNSTVTRWINTFISVQASNLP